MSDGEQLKIQINPDIFSPSNFIKSRKKGQHSGAAKTIRPIPISQLKKRIYNQLRNSDKTRTQDPVKQEMSEFENSFTSSLDYYKSLEQDTASKKRPVNQTIRNNEPLYGNLKGGTKPTYRTWLAKTQTNREPASVIQQPVLSPPQSIMSPPPPIMSSSQSIMSPPPPIMSPPPPIMSSPPPIMSSPPPIMSSSQSIMSPPVQSISTETTSSKPVAKPGGKIIRKKKTLRKFKLGKQDDEKVSVYVPDRKTRKSWNDEFVKIKTVPISSMRKELIDKKLVKVGAGAPNDIVRAIYENMKTIGDVENTSKDVLVHNFFSDATNS